MRGSLMLVDVVCVALAIAYPNASWIPLLVVVLVASHIGAWIGHAR